MIKATNLDDLNDIEQIDIEIISDRLPNKFIARTNNIFMESMVIGLNVINDPLNPFYSRHELSKRSNYCEFCKALMWLNEKAKGNYI